MTQPTVRTFRLISCLLALSCSAATALADTSTELDQLIEATRAEWRTPGVSVAIEHNGRLIHARGYGFADLENRVAASEHTVYRIGSVTKQFTAAAILLLVEDGKLTLDTELRDLLPDYQTHGTTITVHQLLNHTSGIKGYTEMPEFWEQMRQDLDHPQMMGLFGAVPLQFQPGERWQYSNSAYYLLGVIIEKLSGLSYTEFLQQRIFTALDLSETHYLDNAPIVPFRAQGYEVVDGELVNDAPLSMRLPFSAGALGASVTDLMHWQRALRNGRLLEPASFQRMITPVSLNDGGPMTYALGVFTGSLDGHRKIGHGGGINGFRSQLSWYPDADLAIAVLANSGLAKPGDLESAIARMILKPDAEAQH